MGHGWASNFRLSSADGGGSCHFEGCFDGSRDLSGREQGALARLPRFQCGIRSIWSRRNGGLNDRCTGHSGFWFREIEEKAWFVKDPAFDADLRTLSARFMLMR